MPSQPRAPTFRENSGTSVSSRFGLCGSKVPAAISSARKARTSLRNSSHFGGRRIGSKRKAAVIVGLDFYLDKSVRSARGHQRPQFIGAAVAYELAEFDRPITFGTEIVAPGQRAQRVAMQDVLDGEADRAVYLMGDAGALLRRFCAADFCRHRFEEHLVVEGRRIGDGVRGRSRRGKCRRRLAG